jgi:CheY-like chemotaxis protein
VGEGSTFSFNLRRASPSQQYREAEQARPRPVFIPEPAEAPLIEQHGPAEETAFHVLVVDDEAVNRQVIADHLSQLPYRISEASSGPEALEILQREGNVDLILLDIMMPRMSGYEVCEKLRVDHPMHKLPVIFLTAKNQISDLLSGFASGANDYLTKPISKSELLSRVKTHLQLLESHRQLGEFNRRLEQKVEEQTRELRQKNEHILSSIRYAERIQNAILPSQQGLYQALAEHFVLFRPRSIVSGDFFWLHQKGDTCFIAVVDCTGHGVPGAFMSMIGHTLLNKVIIEHEIEEPAQILQHLHIGIREALKQEKHRTGSQMVTQDGMELGLCKLDFGADRYYYAGSRRPLYWVRMNGDQPKLEVIRGDRKSVGGRQKERHRTYSQQELKIARGDMLYLTTDGYMDQHNSQHKKFGVRTFKGLLTDLAPLEMERQKRTLIKELDQFQGQVAQTDDITVLGLRIPKN